jgi:hypothetical protein
MIVRTVIFFAINREKEAVMHYPSICKYYLTCIKSYAYETDFHFLT